jgi:diaminohydroxyphosphoribosylaminopyrimidine deaminase/5-amino-6-(5-phosphoribosylamino)uracil reductase
MIRPTDWSVSSYPQQPERPMSQRPDTVATEQDELHMRRALELAEGGRGRVSPNPLVGAVLVRGGRAIGEGYHAELGAPHAEVAAIEDARRRGASVAGSTLYVTLEPCAHRGRQPACTDAVVRAGIARLVMASDDPSEKASGRGPGILRDEGVGVDLLKGPEAEAARRLNQPFRKHARTARPLVMLKSAMTLDGRTATAGGEAKWISGPDSRALGHRWRAEFDAICVGIETALADDPLLTAREVDAERQPIRVVFDGQARLPVDSALIGSLDEAALIVIVRPAAPPERVAALERAGAEVIVCQGAGPESVQVALDELGRRDVTSLIVEGGATLAGSFVDADEVDELRIFIAPLLFGGADARPVAAGEGVAELAATRRALSTEIERCGEDLLLRARLREW